MRVSLTPWTTRALQWKLTVKSKHPNPTPSLSSVLVASILIGRLFYRSLSNMHSSSTPTHKHAKSYPSVHSYHKSAVHFFQDLLLIQCHRFSFSLFDPLFLQRLACIHLPCSSHLARAHLLGRKVRIITKEATFTDALKRIHSRTVYNIIL